MASATKSKTQPLLSEGQQTPLGRAASEVIDESGLREHVIYMPPSFEAREGVKLTKDYTIGGNLARGNQGAVYKLCGPDGEELDKLLKVIRMKFATPITGADVGLKREWLIGQQLNKLKDDDGNLEGFMGTGEAVVIEDAREVIEGLVLEKLNGWTVDKRLSQDKEFEDAEYILEMLYQVFTALDRAERQFEFYHNDCRLSNIMEDINLPPPCLQHRADASPLLPKGFSSNKQRKQIGLRAAAHPHVFRMPGEHKPQTYHFKVIDYGHASIGYQRSRQRLPRVPLVEHFYMWAFKNKGDVWRLLHSMTAVLDGRTWLEEQSHQVRVFQDLMHEVTGIRLNAFFEHWEELAGNGTPSPSGGHSGNGNGSASAHRRRRRVGRRGLPWQRRRGLGHRLRILYIKWAWHLGMLAESACVLQLCLHLLPVAGLPLMEAHIGRRVKGFLMPGKTHYTPRQALQYLEARAPRKHRSEQPLEHV